MYIDPASWLVLIVRIYGAKEYLFRCGGTGGAGGVIAPPTFGSSITIHSYSTTNIFGWLNIR